LRSVGDPTAYVLELVRLDGEIHPHGDPNDMPDYARIFSEGPNCISALKTREDIDAYIEEKRDEW